LKDNYYQKHKQFFSMKKTTKCLRGWVLVALSLMILPTSFAQGLIDSLSQDESKIVSAIAPYPAEMRAAILDVSQYPQVLVKLERTQGRTSQSFQDLISSYPREEQEKFYQATRYPELISQLVSSGKKSPEEANTIIKDAPQGVQESMVNIYRDHFNELVKINSIYQSSENTLDKITTKYTPQLQADFKKVTESPDVMSLLTDNIDLTVSLGESYRSDPQGVTQYLDDLSSKLTNQNARDLQEYKSAVDNDPKLQEEMKNAANEFARQYDQPDTSPADLNNAGYYGSAPYPYWFGYPYWYASPMWYPSSFYYNTGFYYGANGALVVMGLPSFAYANWFFGYGYNRYPGLYRHYNTYYNTHRTNITNVNVYRGFNTAAHNHFSNVGGRNRPVNTGYRPTENRVVQHVPQTNGHPAQFNTNGFNHYNATSFHSMGWQTMHSNSGMRSGGMHGGGMRGRH
jgi:hypothetical protein